MPRSQRRLGATMVLVLLLAACAAPDERGTQTERLTADEGRARVARLIPDGVSDRAGWATDIYAAVAALDVPPSVDNATQRGSRP